MVTLLVDYNRVGPAGPEHRVKVRLGPGERDALHVGDTVLARGDDDVPLRKAVVADFLDDGRVAVITFEEPWPN